MAVLDPSGIVNGLPVLAPHVKQLIDAFTAAQPYDISINGQLAITGSGVFTQNVTAVNYFGNGINLTGVITDAESSSFVKTSVYNPFAAQYVIDSGSFASRIESNDGEITNLFTTSQSLAGRLNILQDEVDLLSGSYETTSASFQSQIHDLQYSASVHDVFTTGSCASAILPTDGAGNCITGNNTNTFLAAVSSTTVTATTGLANVALGVRSGRICGNQVTDSGIIASNVSCIQGIVNNGVILGGNSNLLGGTITTDGGRASNSSILGSVSSKIGTSGNISCPAPNNSTIVGGTSHTIESSFAIGCTGIARTSILGGFCHTINTNDVLDSAIIGGQCSTVTAKETIVLGSGLTGNVANHTFVEGLNVKNSLTASSAISASGDITGNKIIADGSELTNVRFEAHFNPTTTIAVNHSLNLAHPIVQVWSASGVQVIPSEVTRTSNNQVVVTFAQTTSGSVVVSR